MTLYIMDSGATTAEIDRGVAAAMRVIGDADPAQLEAAQDGPEADQWRAAERAALAACCEGWRTIPDAAYLTAAG